MTLRSFFDLEVICPRPKLLYATLYHSRVISSRVTCAMHMVCLLKAATPAWVTNTVSFLLAIDYIHHSGSFDKLQAKVKCHSSVGPARPVPRVLNKHYSARSGSINVSFMYFT